MTDYYRRWSEENCVRIFADKKIGDFFQSEKKFLQSILWNTSSVLDVGCASGRYIEFLLSIRPELTNVLDFCGIDISEENVANAWRLYPRYDFHTANALEYNPGRTFDLVNATGVCQHEPCFELLIQRLVDFSAKYVMFDVKFAATDDHVVDIERSFAGSAENKLYFVLLNYPRMVTFLQGLQGICKIRIFGYETSINRNTTIPNNISSVVSAEILLEKGEVLIGPEIEADLPFEQLGIDLPNL